MAQPALMQVNGTPEGINPPAKRKRDCDDDGDIDMIKDERPSTAHADNPGAAANNGPPRDGIELILSCFSVLSSFDTESFILKRPLPDTVSDDEPDAKRQKSAEPACGQSISDKVAAGTYKRPGDMVADIITAVRESLADLDARTDDSEEATTPAVRIRDFNKKALDLLRREEAYPLAAEPIINDHDFHQTQNVLSLVGYAPQERRLFSSLPSSQAVDLSQISLPVGVSTTRILPSAPQEHVQSLGEAFAPPLALPPLQPPKQPKTSAKGNKLDFYHPELADKSQFRGNSYFTTKLAAGHFLDYSNATPSSSAKAKQHERAQSLAGKKPSSSELEQSELDCLFRGAFSSFAPCKDDTASVVPSNVAGRMWWQRCGGAQYHNMIEIEYYEDGGLDTVDRAIEIDDKAIQEALDNWDDTVVDPSLEDAMGTKRDEREKEVDEILTEVSDLIETLASYQRIRNLTLPNSQNRPSTDPVAGDMLATSGPQPSEEEQLTYETLKAQLALIIKTLPPYAVARLNGDQLDDLLISTKVEISTDQFRGVMEEDDAGVQARIKAQQQQAANVRTQAPQRTPSTPYANHYQPPAQQYGTPTRPPATPQYYGGNMQRNIQHQTYQQHPQQQLQQYQQQQQHLHPHQLPQQIQPQQQGGFQQQAYQQPRPFTQQPQQRPPQPNQYSRPNGYPNQYATQLAKAQTPYGHQNMPTYANRQGQSQGYAQQATPQRFTHQQNYPQQQGYAQQQQQQQPGTPGFGGFAANGQRTMSPQVPPQPYSPSPNMQHSHLPQPPRYGTPTTTQRAQQGRNAAAAAANSHYNPSTQTPSSLGYHTVIPEAQQQRILEQAKARVAAQERSSSTGRSLSNGSSGSLPPAKVTPVPVPPIPGMNGQQRPSAT